MYSFVEEKKSEIIDCGEYIKIRKYSCIFKRSIIGVTVSYIDRYDKYVVKIKTTHPSDFGPSISGFECDDDAMEVATYLMDICCIKKEI